MVDYPSTRRDDTREQLHGRTVADPYRWLEDPDADETADWVARQNATSSAYLAALPERAWFGATMAAVLARPRAGTPLHRGGRYLVSRNDGRQDQDVWYVADSLPELLEGGRVLVDPNTFSADGTSSLAALAVRGDGAQLAYAVSEGGSDWHTFHLLDVESGAEVPDVGVQTKFSEAVWLPDGRSFVYTAFDHEGHAEGTQTSALAGGKLRLHRVGRPVAEDELLLEFSDERLMLWAETTDDDRWLVVSIVAGTENQNRLWAYPVVTDDGASRLGEPLKVVDEPVAEFTLVRSEGSTLYLSTDDEAERGRVVAVDLEAVRRGRDDAWHEVLAETEHTLGQVVAAGDGFVTVHLVDAQPRVSRYDLRGRLLGPVDLPAGAVVGLEGHAGDDEVFVGLSSVVSPTAAHLVHFGSGEVTPLPGLVRGTGAGFVPPEVTVERSAATSADGTRVPYFLIRAAGVDAGAPRPTLLWGYGGFKIPLFADYRPGWAGWLAAGGVLAIANLRGGGEYGTEWYEAGRLEPQAERLRRLRGRGRAPAVHRCDDAGAAGAARPQQRRPAGGGGDDAAARPGRGGAARRRRAGHAALPPLHGGRGVDLRLRRPARPRPVRRRAGLLAAARRPAGDPLPGDAGGDRRPRRPGRPAAQPQVRRHPAARPGRRRPGAHPGGGGHGPRRGQARRPPGGRVGRPAGLRRPPHRSGAARDSRSLSRPRSLSPSTGSGSGVSRGRPQPAPAP